MKCRICGNVEGNALYVAKEMMYGMREEFNYWQCANCECLQIEEFPEDIARFYPSDSYHSFNDPRRFFRHPLKNKAKALRDYLVLHSKGGIRRSLTKLLKSDPLLPVVAEMDLRSSQRILDVGCGAGVLLYTLRNAGFRNLMGVDPFIDEDIIYSNGLQIKKQFLHQHSGTYDVVMIHHALEHVAEQDDTIQKMFGLLAPGGKLLIRIPIVASYAWQHYKTNWVQLDAPRHFFLHSPKSLQKLVEPKGFKLEKIVYDSSAIQVWGSELYLKDLPLKVNEKRISEIFGQKWVQGCFEKARALNDQQTGDQAAFIFRKR